MPQVVLTPPLFNQMSAATRQNQRPLRAEAVEDRVYALQTFFICVLRWLKRLPSRVLMLRPLVCSALFGRFPGPSVDSTVEGNAGDLMTPNSLTAHMLERYTLTHRGRILLLLLSSKWNDFFGLYMSLVLPCRHSEDILPVDSWRASPGNLPQTCIFDRIH